jgi:N-dimethylarginine dimethylaminohydrolase
MSTCLKWGLRTNGRLSHFLLGVEVYVGYFAGWLDLWGFPNEGTPHADMVFTMVDVGLALNYPPFWDYGTIKHLKSQKIRLIQIPVDEYMTYVGEFNGHRAREKQLYQQLQSKQSRD